jgi:hypothetical protein
MLLERKLQLVTEELHGALSVVSGRNKSLPNGESAVSTQTSLTFDADSLSKFSQGFYEREYDDSGHAFRWTGNGPLCELRFFVDRTEDRSFTMNVGNADSNILSLVSGFVDYARIPLAIERDNLKFVVTGTIPQRAYTKLAVISFLLASAEAQGEWLGFPFYSFSVNPTAVSKSPVAALRHEKPAALPSGRTKSSATKRFKRDARAAV